MGSSVGEGEDACGARRSSSPSFPIANPAPMHYIFPMEALKRIMLLHKESDQPTAAACVTAASITLAANTIIFLIFVFLVCFSHGRHSAARETVVVSSRQVRRS